MSIEQRAQARTSVIKRFSALKEGDRLAHAYLFVGPPGSGKASTALAVAKLINCESPQESLYCDNCASCQKANAGNHPDVFIIDNEEGESIKIGQMRELLAASKLRPFFAQKKIYIITNTEQFTAESANAFLKTLEEPSAQSLILLTTSAPEKNLDTIRSRCHAIYFPAEGSGALAQKLVERFGLNERESHFLAYFAQGCFGMAEKLHESQFIDRKNEYLNGFILNRPADAEIKDLLADKAQTKEFLDICSSWLRDAMLAKVKVEDTRLINLDRIEDLRKFQERYTFEELRGLNTSVIKMHQLLADNLNIKLPLMIIGEQLWDK